MEVILKSDVKGLGGALDLVRVKDGYARNYLFPRQLAVLATAGNKSILEEDRQKAAAIYLKERQASEAVAEKLKGFSLTMSVKITEEEKLYGSVSSKEIAAKLVESGFAVDRKQVDLPEPIKKLGMYSVKVLLPPDIEAKIKVWVIADESEKAAQ